VRPGRSCRAANGVSVCQPCHPIGTLRWVYHFLHGIAIRLAQLYFGWHPQNDAACRRNASSIDRPPENRKAPAARAGAHHRSRSSASPPVPCRNRNSNALLHKLLLTKPALHTRFITVLQISRGVGGSAPKVYHAKCPRVEHGLPAAFGTFPQLVHDRHFGAAYSFLDGHIARANSVWRNLPVPRSGCPSSSHVSRPTSHGGGVRRWPVGSSENGCFLHRKRKSCLTCLTVSYKTLR
jgi:hypothetical protein